MGKWLAAIVLSTGAILNAQTISDSKSQNEISPWLTGSLIAPVGTAVPYGDFLVRSYVYFTAETGSYTKGWRAVSNAKNFYSLNPQFQLYFGLTPWCDLNVTPQFFYNFTYSQHYFNIGDLIAGLDFQLMEPDYTPYFPGIKFAVREVFPTGNFKFLSPRKLFTDETGAGAFATQLLLVFYKQFHLHEVYWLSTNFSAQYTINFPVNVQEFNAYGGGFGTRGKVLPGNIFQGIASFELSLSQNWVLAFDSVYTHVDDTKFFGRPGITFYGEYARVGGPFSEQFSFAPAIEYNFSQDFGIIAGCWFSAFGKNSTEFRSGVINFNYLY